MNWPPWLTFWRSTSTLQAPAPWLMDAFGGTPSASGVVVSDTNALSQAAVYACVRVLADSVAQLPLKVQRIDQTTRTDDHQHVLWTLLHDLPNPEMTAFELKHVLQQHLALYGNAYVEIERDGFGRPVALWPLNPTRMTVERSKAFNKLWRYQLPDGQPVVWEWIDPARRPSPILHLRGLGDGHVGYSPLRLLRESIGRAIATEEYGARLFSNSAEPRGYISAKGTLKANTAQMLKKQWEDAHRGLSNAHRVAVLEDGLEWHQIGMSADDAQFIESRKLNVNDIARAFRVPPHMIGDLERATFSNIEHQAIEFVVHSLMPWLVCWEQAIARDLLSVKSFETHQVRFVVDGLLRGDLESRNRAFAIGRQWGWFSINDVRRYLDLNPIGPEGDVYLNPVNMQDAKVPLHGPQLSDPTPNEPDPDTVEASRLAALLADHQGLVS